MVYALRDASGHICSLQREPVDGAQALPPDHPDVVSFLGQSPEEAQAQFAYMDAGLVRVLEDLIDALIRRNVLCITDLPLEAQLKLFDRKHFREGMHTHALQLFGHGAPRDGAHAANPEHGGWSDSTS